MGSYLCTYLCHSVLLIPDTTVKVVYPSPLAAMNYESQMDIFIDIPLKGNSKMDFTRQTNSEVAALCLNYVRLEQDKYEDGRRAVECAVRMCSGGWRWTSGITSMSSFFATDYRGCFKELIFFIKIS